MEASSTSKVSIRPLNRFNWEEAASLELHDYQKDFMPSNLHSIAQSKYENLIACGIFADETLVGFAMYGNFSGVCWINRIMVDKAYQEMGYGRAALDKLVGQLKTRPDCAEIRTSFVRQNAIAEYFFSQAGFHRISDGLEGEIVMRWTG